MIFIEHESLYGSRGEVPDDGDHDRSTSARRRSGARAATSRSSASCKMAEVAEQAAKTLANEHGVEAEVIDPRTLRPLDLDTILESVRKTNRAVIVEEGWPHGGVGANLAALIQEQAFDYLDAPVAARHRRRRADALLEAPGAGGDPPRRARRQRGARDPRGEPLMADARRCRGCRTRWRRGRSLKWLKAVGDEVAVGRRAGRDRDRQGEHGLRGRLTAGTLTEIVAEEGDDAADRRGDRAGRGCGGRRR